MAHLGLLLRRMVFLMTASHQVSSHTHQQNTHTQTRGDCGCMFHVPDVCECVFYQVLDVQYCVCVFYQVLCVCVFHQDVQYCVFYQDVYLCVL